LLWFLRDYPLAAVLLRALTLAFSMLLIGGLFFGTVLLPRNAVDADERTRFLADARRLFRAAALGLALAQLLFVATDTAMLMGTGGLSLEQLVTARFFWTGSLIIVVAIVFLVISHFRFPRGRSWLLFAIFLFVALTLTSHSASRLEDWILLMVLTGMHQAAAGIWIGGMPYLWLLLRPLPGGSSASAAWKETSMSTARRYSNAAFVSVGILIGAGVSLGWLYTRSWSALYGTDYGVVLVAKAILLTGLLGLGAGNFLWIRRGRLPQSGGFARIARFSEAEIAIGFTIIIAAASLSAQPPAVDLTQNRLTVQEIATRIEPHWPRLRTPPIKALPPVEPMSQSMRDYARAPDGTTGANNRFERAWSEYNHHWAGIAVMAAGFLALFGRWRRAPWARHWPLIFLGLAAFLFFRADPEAWPLGSRGFWDSFYNPADLEHRIFVLLIIGFAGFEWAVQTERATMSRAALAFPLVAIAGGALLLTHDHSLGNVQEALLANMSHTAIAICAVFAGSSRWMELRLAGGEGGMKHAAAWAWPLCLIFIGLILLDYREA
jgi:putative copper resistance protein D